MRFSRLLSHERAVAFDTVISGLHTYVGPLQPATELSTTTRNFSPACPIDAHPQARDVHMQCTCTTVPILPPIIHQSIIIIINQSNLPSRPAPHKPEATQNPLPGEMLFPNIHPQQNSASLVPYMYVYGDTRATLIAPHLISPRRRLRPIIRHTYRFNGMRLLLHGSRHLSQQLATAGARKPPGFLGCREDSWEFCSCDDDDRLGWTEWKARGFTCEKAD